ncbi:hypothetical protein FRB95_001902 [Tulasnella sp. JGI-2019a]|nr:hypothetical protein FRB95_001902 [Tulasnella sp. JGI-2019a]
MVGDATKKFHAPSWEVFYLNDIAKAIAKDYSNPITRLAMQDYPEDGGDGMSQVFNGSKMLHDLPVEHAPLTVHVDGKIFWVNELLQFSSGGYFILEKYIAE